MKNKKETNMEKIYIDKITVNIFSQNNVETYYENDRITEIKGYKNIDPVEFFELEPFHYASVLADMEQFTQSFNTYNWGAPITICGAYNENMEAIVNVHRGGDARGNYSAPYLCENVEYILSQYTELVLEISNGETYRISCENGEAYFHFHSDFDPYYFDIEEPVSEAILTEIRETMEKFI